MFRRKHPLRSSRLHVPAAHAVEALEGRVLLSTYMVTNLNDSGAGSLRGDILMSNATPGTNTITFAPGLSGTITLSSGQLEVNNDLTITGPGASLLTISGNMQSRVFQVDAGVTASISDLTITGGKAPNGAPGVNANSMKRTPGGPGGPGGDGGGVNDLGSLTLVGDVISGNNAGSGGIGGAGGVAGGIPPMTLNAGPGGPGGNGGGVYSSGSLSILGCTIAKNTSGFGAAGGNGSESFPGGGGAGGGICSSSGTLTIVNSAIDSNTAGSGGPGMEGPGADGGRGGGVFASSVSIITGSTISRNHAGAGGHGPPLQNTSGDGGSGGGICSVTSLVAANCTISGNAAGNGGPPIGGGSPGNGGGIASDGLLRLTNVTVGGNTSFAMGAGLFVNSGDAVLNNTIVGDSVGGAPLDPASSHDLIGGNADLGPLADYGGPTQTMAPLPGSPAIDAGSNALAIGPDGTPLLTDQRGLARIFNGTVDIGACEFGSHLLGDANGDGKVDFTDLVLVARNYGKTSATWADGDFNNDGSVGFDDLVIVARNYGKSTTAAAEALAASFAGSTLSPSLATPSDVAELPRHRRRP